MYEKANEMALIEDQATMSASTSGLDRGYCIFNSVLECGSDEIT